MPGFELSRLAKLGGHQGSPLCLLTGNTFRLFQYSTPTKPLAGRVLMQASILSYLRFGDFYKAFLNKLDSSRHGVCVDLDVGN